ncbi:DUF202 domain-containing protein [Rothia uropygioeca]|uniref:DUF202 domain-containing protein n=1 Tax=Kocuria sp. 257 TaxID=2021970 RepID=UPI001EDD7E50|nr:DUF202 domain-containing protein [Kocuria sp. 257]
MHIDPEADSPADPGLQPERTALAWGRTLLAVGVVGAGFLRWLPHFGWWVVLLALLAWLVSLSIYGTQRRRYRRQSRGVRHGSLSAAPVAVLGTGAAVACLCVIGVVIILVTRG